VRRWRHRLPGDVDEASPPILSSTARLLVLARIDVALVRTERADRPRSDFCIAMAELVAEEVDPACLVLVRGERLKPEPGDARCVHERRTAPRRGR
jgi:hypothetical protein